MYRFAQTNIQLFNEMYDLGYDEKEMALVKKSYELAIILFTGRFRGSGKTFIAHLIGTASILVSLRSSSNIIAAGLLHAAYDSGDFGDGGKGLTPEKRPYVKSAVGDDVEDYIARYTEFRWNQRSAQSVFEKLDTLSQAEREVLLIRLANELEDFLDLGILFCGEQKRTQAGYLNAGCQLLPALATKLGHPELAEALRITLERTEVASKQRRFGTSSSRDFSFLTPPLSYKRMMEVLAARLNQTPRETKD